MKLLSLPYHTATVKCRPSLVFFLASLISALIFPFVASSLTDYCSFTILRVFFPLLSMIRKVNAVVINTRAFSFNNYFLGADSFEMYFLPITHYTRESCLHIIWTFCSIWADHFVDFDLLIFYDYYDY